MAGPRSTTTRLQLLSLCRCGLSLPRAALLLLWLWLWGSSWGAAIAWEPHAQCPRLPAGRPGVLLSGLLLRLLLRLLLWLLLWLPRGSRGCGHARAPCSCTLLLLRCLPTAALACRARRRSCEGRGRCGPCLLRVLRQQRQRLLQRAQRLLCVPGQRPS